MTKLTKVHTALQQSIEWYLRGVLNYLGDGTGFVRDRVNVKRIPQVQLACAAEHVRTALDTHKANRYRVNLCEATMNRMDKAFRRFEQDAIAFTWKQRASLLRREARAIVRDFNNLWK